MRERHVHGELRPTFFGVLGAEHGLRAKPQGRAAPDPGSRADAGMRSFVVGSPPGDTQPASGIAEAHSTAGPLTAPLLRGVRGSPAPRKPTVERQEAGDSFLAS
jgi:hypothetical protein